MDQIWTRRDDESHVAYEAFKVYMRVRTTAKTAEELGKHPRLPQRWCADYNWVERVRAYDRYIATADTDGMVHALSEVRDKNLALMDKLRGLLDSRLDEFIARKDDPTIRWTQACVAMTKIEANSLAMADTKRSTEKIESIMALVDRALELQNREPEDA